MEKPVVNFGFRHKLISFLTDIDIRGIRKVAHHLPDLLIPMPQGELIIRTLYGFLMKINPVQDQEVEKNLYFTGTYEKGTLHVIKNLLKKGDTFVDVGANIGLMSIFASYLVKNSGKIYAFEPQPVTRSMLEENIRLNHITNIEICAQAIGNRNGESLLFDNAQNRGGATLIKTQQNQHHYSIDMITLSEQFKNQSVHMIKIDVEGFELHALAGAMDILQRSDPPILIVECSQSLQIKNPASEIFDLIKSANQYRIFKSVKGKGRVSPLIEVKHSDALPFHDNIYCFSPNHQIPARLLV